MFLISTLVPNASVPGGRIEMFASQRSDPSSMRTSLTSSDSSVARNVRRYAPASSGEAHIQAGGSHSTSGTPARLKTISAESASWIRPLALPCRSSPCPPPCAPA